MQALFVVGLCMASALTAYAQNGTFSGTVARDLAGTAVGGAQLQIPQLNRPAVTNWQGEFRFGDVPAGRYVITVRAVGFAPLIDTINVRSGAVTDGDIILTATPVNLAAQRTTATVEKRLPPGLAEMEERRKTGLGGHFVTDSALRTNDGRKVTYLLAEIPGIRQLNGNGGGLFIANGKVNGQADCKKLPPGVRSAPPCDFPPMQCYVDVYVNGARYFVGPATALNPPPDFNAMWNAEYSSIEFYSGGATIPAQYNATGSRCGVMLLWTRRTP